MNARTPAEVEAGAAGLHPAAERQRAASDPRRSTWLAANAGSGKTRVLTERVARLLLGGADPQAILCLTYTKAAAAEMQARLVRVLGRWSMTPDDALAAELTRLGLGDGLPGGIEKADLPRARRLFAQALETPGGLKIQTIHAFCASLLRRFPLEAGVSPEFREMDDAAAAQLRAEVAEAMAAGPEAPLVDALARHLSEATFDEVLLKLVELRESFADPHGEPALRAALGLADHHTEEALLAAIASDARRRLLSDLRALCGKGGTNDLKAHEALAPLCAAARLGLDALEALEGLLLTGAGAKEPFAPKRGAFPTKAARKADPALAAAIEDDLHALMDEVAAGRDARLGLLALGRARSLHAFAAAFVPAYEARKAERGLLEFDDLIARAHRLLTEPAVAAWVLWRLDGGIDHILVDEAQDTSPKQWAVIERLAAEFSAGEGARPERARTLFVVGDRKQSIYSFQGADVEGFDAMRRLFGERLAGVGKDLHEEALEHSFRSSHAVLDVVDRTFRQLAGNGELALREALGDAESRHRAFHEAMPGRVDLWPVVPKAEKVEEGGDWFVPVDRLDPRHEDLLLANHVADLVRDLLHARTPVPRPGEGGGWDFRPLRPEDVLILVRGRQTRLFGALNAALKTRGVPVAGADRLKVRADLAARDVEAVLRALALPQDDLALACALRSPLMGWDEAALYRLAQPRPEGASLWDALAAGPPCEALDILSDLRDKADFLRPFDLMGRLLGRHDGRRRLVARLGPEADDALDALCGQALAYEAERVPSLTGFLDWIASGEAEVKRRTEASEGLVRVMTVHGAKGLEAPVVILPDAAKPEGAPRLPRLWTLPGADGRPLPIWAPRTADLPAALAARREALLAADARERRRLLYVAMTRAQSWLVVAAAGTAGASGESWHAAVADGLGDAAAAHPFPTGAGRRLERGDWACPAPEPDQAAPKAAEPDPSPDEPGPPAPPPPRAVTLSPSDLGGAKAIWEGHDAEEEEDGEAARARGRLLHLALEHLPRLPGEDGAARVLALLRASAQAAETPEEAAGAGLADLDDVLGQARALVADPRLAPLWADDALAEATLSADVPPLGRLHGAVDRLLVGPARVTAIDFKSNRVVPQAPEAIPEGLLRQMGAYAAMLGLLYPGREVQTALLWTRTGALMDLPPVLTAAALARAVPAAQP